MEKLEIIHANEYYFLIKTGNKYYRLDKVLNSCNELSAEDVRKMLISIEYNTQIEVLEKENTTMKSAEDQPPFLQGLISKNESKIKILKSNINQINLTLNN